MISNVPFRRWFLPLSLALNVFLATIILMHPSHHRPGPPNPAQIASEIAQTLPPADGEILLKAFATHAAEIERGDHLRHSVPGRIKTALEQPKLDIDALKAIFADNRAASIMLDDALAATIVETASRISDEGRAKLAQWRPPHPPGPQPGPRP